MGLTPSGEEGHDCQAAELIESQRCHGRQPTHRYHKTNKRTWKSIFQVFLFDQSGPCILHGTFSFLYGSTRANPCENRGRKAMGLPPSGEEGHDRQAAETLFAHKFPIGFNVRKPLFSNKHKGHKR